MFPLDFLTLFPPGFFLTMSFASKCPTPLLTYHSSSFQFWTTQISLSWRLVVHALPHKMCVCDLPSTCSCVRSPVTLFTFLPLSTSLPSSPSPRQPGSSSPTRQSPLLLQGVVNNSAEAWRGRQNRENVAEEPNEDPAMNGMATISEGYY